MGSGYLRTARSKLDGWAATFRTPGRQRMLLAARIIAIFWIIAFWIDRGLMHPHLTADGMAYWGSGDGVLYEYPWLAEQSGLPVPYVYSPAFAQAIRPLTQLSLPAFMATAH
jgi:hypothetical protein